MEITQMSISYTKTKHSVIYLYNGILFNKKKIEVQVFLGSRVLPQLTDPTANSDTKSSDTPVPYMK
jgi:hypothetical protein